MSQDPFQRLHPKVQRAIFDMGWKQLRPIQEQAIETLLTTDQHLLICAATASGKTEAAFLPVISSLADTKQTSIRAIYVGPLKALINDQFARLESLCEQLELPVHRWHGDVAASRKQALRRDPGGILLITPESLESNFINYGNQVPALYRELDYLVIDELHSFIADVRGVHLLSLLSRLRSATGRRPRMIGLSATLADPQMARRFLSPNEPNRVAVLQDNAATREVRLAVKAVLQPAPSRDRADTPPRLSAKQTLDLVRRCPHEELRDGLEPTTLSTVIDAHAPPPPNQDELDDIADELIQHFATSTNLIFVNSKTTAEKLAVRAHDRVKQLKWPHDPFVIHHGSIARELREETEALLKSGRPTTAICSSTLEMGIDIGSVRAVGQIDPPWSVASLVQRLGRSGRRENEASILRLYVREESPSHRSSLTDLLFPDLLQAVALTRLMQQKWLEPPDEHQMHLSTLVHQLLSHLKQTGGLKADALYNALAVDGPFRHIRPPDFALLLRALAHRQLIEQMASGELILAPEGEKIAANRDFYAAFTSTERFRVRHNARDIGELPQELLPPSGQLIVLAGKRWRVDEIDSTSKTVRVSPAAAGKTPQFRGGGGELHARVVEEMKAVLLGHETPPYLDPPATELLKAARHVAQAVGLTQSDLLPGSKGVQWFPWVGTRCLRTLAILLQIHRVRCQTDRLCLKIEVDDEGAVRHLARKILAQLPDPTELSARVVPPTLDKFDEYLPDDLRLAAIAADRLALPEATEALSNLA